MSLLDDLREWDPDRVRAESAAPVTAASLRVRATSTSNQTVARYVASIKETCVRAADQGRTGVSIEFDSSFRLPYEIRETVKRALEADGFKVTYYDGDQRDPCSGITVQW